MQGEITMSPKETYIGLMKQQLDELNARMYELEANAKEISEDVRNKYKSELRKLRQQSQMTTDMFAELKIASEDMWESKVADAERLRDAFIHSLHYFKT
jgi:hypothetical protein